MKTIYLRAKKCPVCGKRFYPAPFHVYKQHGTGNLVCSWGCVVESERAGKPAIATDRNYCTPRVASRMSAVSEKRIRRMAASGKLPAVKVDGHWYIKKADLREYMRTEGIKEEI